RVRRLDERVRAAQLLAELRDSEARRDLPERSLDPRHFRAEPFTELATHLQVGIVEQDAELLAAVSGDEVVLADPLLERVRHAHEDFVPRLVAELVVELLEVIDIDHRQAEPPASAGGGDEL